MAFETDKLRNAKLDVEFNRLRFNNDLFDLRLRILIWSGLWLLIRMAGQLVKDLLHLELPLGIEALWQFAFERGRPNLHSLETWIVIRDVIVIWVRITAAARGVIRVVRVDACRWSHPFCGDLLPSL